LQVINENQVIICEDLRVKNLVKKDGLQRAYMMHHGRIFTNAKIQSRETRQDFHAGIAKLSIIANMQ